MQEIKFIESYLSSISKSMDSLKKWPANEAMIEKYTDVVVHLSRASAAIGEVMGCQVEWMMASKRDSEGEKEAEK